VIRRNWPLHSNTVTGRQGSVLLIVCVAIFIIAAATTTILMVTANAIHLSNAQQARVIALNVAESGADRAFRWLKDQSTPPTNTTAFDPLNGAQSLGPYTYQVTMYPDSSNPSNTLKTYRVVSTATCLGATRRVETVLKQASFGKYAYFTDQEVSSISQGAISWKAGDRIDGPVFSNNANGTDFYINYNGSTSPIFLDTFTGAGDSIHWTPGTPSGETTYRKIFATGSSGYKLGADPILLPDSSTAQKNSAWGSTSGFPTTNGVYVKSSAAGGIYIKGDAAILMSLDAGGNQKIAITVGLNTTTITINRSSRTATASGSALGSGSDTGTMAMPNGVIYCTGNITSLKGTIADNLYSNGQVTLRSAYTIATDVNADKDINITGNLVYNTKPNKTLSPTATCNLAAGTLGLVSRNTCIDSTAPNTCEVDGVILAGGQNTSDGSFYAENYNTRSVGTLTVLGGIIQKQRGPMGTMNGSTGSQSTGFNKNYNYDIRLGVNPPPCYPTTGEFEQISWKVLAP
jgi:hypothetical protein